MENVGMAGMPLAKWIRSHSDIWISVQVEREVNAETLWWIQMISSSLVCL